MTATRPRTGSRHAGRRMPMDVDLIVFDMAGTTVRDGGAVSRALKEALATAGVLASLAEVHDVMGLPTPAAIGLLLARFRGAGSASPLAIEAVHNDFVRRMLWHYESHYEVRECDGASDLFAWCHRHDIQVALDTGLSRIIADAIITRLGWRTKGLIDASVASDEVTHGRPHPDMIQHLMWSTEVSDPRRVVKIGDTPADIEQGLAAGCRCVIGITTGSHTAEELHACRPTHLVDELLELPDLLAATKAGAA